MAVSVWLAPLREQQREKESEQAVIYKPVSVLVMAGAGQGNDHKYKAQERRGGREEEGGWGQQVRECGRTS